MAAEQKQRTGEINSRLWGARAADWANIQEAQCRPVYLAMFDRTGLGPGTAYFDAAALVAALKPLLPPPPPGAPGPFALSDEGLLRGFATDAGLDPVEVVDVDSPWRYPDLATALRGLKSSGVSVRAIDNSSEEAADSAHAKALAPFRRSDGSYQIGATFRCLIARA